VPSAEEAAFVSAGAGVLDALREAGEGAGVPIVSLVAGRTMLNVLPLPS
jgi:hypothetical protein